MFEFFVALSCGFGGLLAGCYLRGITHHPVAGTIEAEPGAELEDAAKIAQDQSKLKRVAEQLRQVSMRVAADVDEHQSKVQHASRVLSGNQNLLDSDTILEAVNQLVRANEEMQIRLNMAQERIQKQASQIQSAEAKAATDALTKLHNRRAFDAYIEKCQSNGSIENCVLMILDVDKFKSFNDNHGHLAGDEVLRRVSTILSVRLSDVAFVARYGGEEFAAVFTGRSYDECQKIAEETRCLIGTRSIHFEGQDLAVRASMGLAKWNSGEERNGWIKRADSALYHSKQTGRDRGHWMDGDKPRPINLSETKPAIESSQRLSVSLKTKEQAIVSTEGAPNAIARIPAEPKMREMFSELKARLQHVSVDLFVILISCDQEPTKAANHPHILRVTRATVRSLDHVGKSANGDLMVYMPSADVRGAIDRADRICQGIFSATQSSSGTPVTVSIGITWVPDNESFDEIRSQAEKAVTKARQAGGNQVVVQGYPA